MLPRFPDRLAGGFNGTSQVLPSAPDKGSPTIFAKERLTKNLRKTRELSEGRR